MGSLSKIAAMSHSIAAPVPTQNRELSREIEEFPGTAALPWVHDHDSVDFGFPALVPRPQPRIAGA